MLSPIPAQMLRHTVSASIPAGTDADNRVTSSDEYTVTRCCVQRANQTVKTRENTSVTLTAVLFIDRRLTLPRLDWEKLKQNADRAGGEIRITHMGREYTVLSVGAFLDDIARVHHYELGLV